MISIIYGLEFGINYDDDIIFPLTFCYLLSLIVIFYLEIQSRKQQRHDYMTFQELKNISRTLQLFKDGILIITQSEGIQENDQFEFPFMNDQFKKEFEIEEDHQAVFLKHNNSFGNIFSENDLKNEHEIRSQSQIQQSNRQVQYQQKQETTNFPPQNSYPQHLNKGENQSQISNFQNNGNCFGKNSKVNSFKNFEDKGSSKISSQIEYLLQLVVTNINKQQSRQLGINTNNNQQNYQNSQQTLYTKIKKMFAQQNNTNNNNLNSDNIQQSQFIPNTERYNLVILDDETKEKNYYEISLDKSIWKEQQSVIVVFRNVTETFRADELQRLNEQKDIIMATVSHDLKNPIAGIIGCIEQVLNQNTVSDFADKYSQNLLLNSQNNVSPNKDISKQNFDINVHNQAALVNSIPNVNNSNININSNNKNGLNLPQKQSINQVLEEIRNIANVLLFLVKDIQDIALLKHNKLKLFPKYTDLNSILNETISFFKHELQNKNLKLKLKTFYENSPIPYFIFNDPVRIQQIIMNLLSNAIKYTKSGQITIIVELQQNEANHFSIKKNENQNKKQDHFNYFKDNNIFHKTSNIEKSSLNQTQNISQNQCYSIYQFNNHDNLHQDIIKISVKDTGMGITKEIMSVLFDEFQTTDNNTNSYGVGLGLCIAQKLANCVGPQQKIQVKSSPGVGSKFSFKIYTHRKRDNELIKESYLENENYHSQTMISPSKIQVKMPLISGPTKLIDGLSTSNSQQFYSPRNSINKVEINNQNSMPEKNNNIRLKQESKFDKLFQDEIYNQSPFLNKKTKTLQQIQSDIPINMYKSQLEGSQQQQKQQQYQQTLKYKQGNKQMKALNQEYDQDTDNNTNYFNKSPTQNLTQSNMVLLQSNFLIKSRQLISSQAIHNINRQVSMTPAQLQNKFIQQFLQNYQKIMLVDDQIFNIKSQKIFLSRFGKFQYYECIDGEEAVQQIKDIQEKQKDNTSNFDENQIDMILLDKQMGRFKMNGLQTAEQIKAICPNILIILCTSQLEPDEKYSYIDGSIEKPISVSKFYQLVQDLLKEQECVSDVQNLSPSQKQKYR